MRGAERAVANVQPGVGFQTADLSSEGDAADRDSLSLRGPRTSCSALEGSAVAGRPSQPVHAEPGWAGLRPLHCSQVGASQELPTQLTSCRGW